MAERKQVDWESVERDYSAGLLSLRELADKYGVAESYIRKKANQKDWSRDLSAKIQSKAEKLVRSEVVRSEVRTEKAISEKEVIEANAQAIVSVKLKHRTSIGRLNSVVDSLLAEIEVLNKDKSVDNLPVRVDMTKKLMDTLRISIDKERQAFGITDAPTPTDDAIRDLLKGLNKNALNTQTTFDLDDDE